LTWLQPLPTLTASNMSASARLHAPPPAAARSAASRPANGVPSVPWWQPLREELLGPDSDQHPGIKRLLLTAPVYAFGCALLALSAVLGLVPAWQVAVQTAFSVLGLLVFYVLLRSGATARLPDPALTLPQVLFGTASIALSYGMTELTRGAALQLLCLALVFDMQRLEARQVRLVAGGTVLILGLMLAVMGWLAPEGLDLPREALNIAMAVVMLPVLSIVAREVRRIRVRQLEQKTQLTATLRQLHKLSTRDSLTDLYNRRHMMHLLEREMKRQARKGGVFSVAILDIDHFKRVNDQHGHAVGDAVLRDFSKRIRRAIRECDVVARWGGEEFLVLMPGTGRPQALLALERMRAKVVKHDWSQHAPGLTVRFSAGVAQHNGAELIHRTLEQADLALYQAKSAGRDRAVGI
jgi:diguanylate cyclase (GGDEF)-like protein